MGRKIPGRKHHGVRDPEKQQAVRFNKIKDKINAPPTNPDSQDIPKSLARIMELKDKVKSGYYNGKRKKIIKVDDDQKQNKPILNVKNKNINKSQQNRPKERVVPEFKQYPKETDRAFLHRVNRICESVQKEAAFEDKYGVEIRRNAQTGEVEDVVKRPKDELQVLINKTKKEEKDKKNKKKKKKKDEGPKLTKSQKWQKKKTEKKKKLSEKDLDFDDFKDQVKFGETVHAPPTLVAPRRVEKQVNAPRPGQKPLLLKSMLGPKENTSQNVVNRVISNSEVKLKKIQNKTIDKKGKRKDLPNALRRQLDKQQKEIIEAYKLLKSKKYN